MRVGVGAGLLPADKEAAEQRELISKVLVSPEQVSQRLMVKHTSYTDGVVKSYVA